MTADLCENVPALLAQARAGDADALGRLLERFRNYLSVLARIQIGRRLQRKVEEADLVQETFLEAHRAFPRFRGTSEGELAYWLRQILTARLAMLVRHYFGTQQRDVTLERELTEALDHSSEQLGTAFVASGTSRSQGAVRREEAVRLATEALTLLHDLLKARVLAAHALHKDGSAVRDEQVFAGERLVTRDKSRFAGSELHRR